MLEPMPSATIDDAAARLADLLMGGGDVLADPDPAGARLEFEADVAPRHLARASAAPADVWAVDGGQALVADARCVQVIVTRASRVRFRHGRCVLEQEGELRAHVLGAGHEAVARAGVGLAGVAPDSSVDDNLLGLRWERDEVDRCVAYA